jgi:PAS domain S-box-containing protein
MFDLIDFYFYLLLLSGFISINLSIYLWIKFKSPFRLDPASILFWILFGVTIWSFGAALALFAPNAAETYFFEQFKYLGILIIPPTWLILSLKWTSRGEWINLKNALLILSVSFLLMVFVFTDSFHHLIWREIEYVKVGSYLANNVVHGIGWWLMLFYLFSLLFIGTFYLILNIFKMKSMYQKQSIIILLALLFPWVSNIIFALELFPISYIDPTPIAFLITGFLFTIGFSKFKLVDIVPIARRVIFDHLDDPVFVVDSSDRVVELNPAAEKTFNIDAEKLIGNSVDSIIKKDPYIKHQLNINKRKGLTEIFIDTNKERKCFDVRTTPLFHTIDKLSGNIVSLRDITERKKAEEESQKLALIVKYSSELINLADLKGNMIFLNEAGSKMLGINPKDVEKYHITEVIPNDLLDKVNNEVLPSIMNKGGWEGDLRYKNIKTGKQTDVHATTFSINDPITNKPQYLANVSLDISKRKKDEVTIQKQVKAISSSIDGIAIFNKYEKYVYTNNALVKLHGYKNPKEIIGKSWEEFYNDKEIKRFKNEIFPSLKKRGIWNGEITGVKKNGTAYFQEITLTSLGDGGFIFVVKDITKQKMVINELQDAHELLYTVNKDLERKVKRRTSEIERLIKQKDEFINQLGHDLKTPLTPMMVLLPLLRENAQSDKENGTFDVVIRNVYFMKDLVNKTIDLAKLSSDIINFNFEPIILYDEVENMISNNRILFEENNISIKKNIDKNLIVQADKLQLDEILNNLISNSIKYTPEAGGEIKIDAKDEKDFVVISLADSGIGMTKEQLKQIFNEFYKADESRHNLDSSGLGLTITKKIIEKHGGKIWAESKGKGKGSTFYFTLKKYKTIGKK